MNAEGTASAVGAEVVLDQVDALLEREREAIRAMRASEVESIAAEKEVLFGQLAQFSQRKDLAERIAQIALEARRNCILLAHARDCTREAVGAIAQHLNSSLPPPGLGRATESGRRGLKISVTG